MLLVLSSLFGATGGIPAFNRLLLRAAAEYTEHQGERLRVVALTDAVKTVPPIERIDYVPCGGSRQACVLETLRPVPGTRQGQPRLFGHVNLAPLGLCGALFGWPYGVVAHGTEVWSPLPWHRRLALASAAAVACVSQDTANRVQNVQGVAKARCVRVINAIDEVPALAEDGAACRPAGPLRLLSVTRLHPGEPKGIELVLRALAGLPQGAAVYTVIGDGAARASLAGLADKLGLGEQVRFTGALSDAARDRALTECDVFVLPSTSEGFGIVYLEAMARNKPCIAARAGGAPEVVLDGITGLVIEPAVEAVRAALLRLADAELRRLLGTAGRARVAEHFTYEAFRCHAFALFERLARPAQRP